MDQYKYSSPAPLLSFTVCTSSCRYSVLMFFFYFPTQHVYCLLLKAVILHSPHQDVTSLLLFALGGISHHILHSREIRIFHKCIEASTFHSCSILAYSKCERRRYCVCRINSRDLHVLHPYYLNGVSSKR